ncbi:3-hydroxy-acyl-CoA-dehydrogenase [Marasmius fiardii PR-910]|nr:3-hydroxy-acyl-CoA-dehydrogenase [Marasmius fiardii PR-910]
MRIENRTFIVSGGSSGLGLATVRELLTSKAYVAVLDRNPPPSMDGNTTGASTSRLCYFEVDIIDVDQVSDVVEKVVSWTSQTNARLGGVINCAGVGVPELVITTKGKLHSKQRWDQILGVNLHGTFHLIRLAMKHLIQVPQEDTEDAERGVVIMVSSTVAYEGLAGQTAYAASKGAICSMTLPMARELGRFNIRVVTLVPGLFTTPLTDQLGEKVAKDMHREALQYPRRYGKPGEFAHAVRWVVECPYVNGENIKLTGGIRVPARM